MLDIYIFMIVALISFGIGIVLHEFGHKIFCNLTGVRVIGMSFFDADIEADGLVIHEKPKTLMQSFLITIGPLFTVGSVLFLVVLFFLKIPVFGIDILPYMLVAVIGLVMSMFPSTHDVDNLIEFIRQNHKEYLLPFAYLLKACSYYHVRLILAVVGFIILLVVVRPF